MTGDLAVISDKATAMAIDLGVAADTDVSPDLDPSSSTIEKGMVPQVCLRTYLDGWSAVGRGSM
jgi:hypothetical protein